MNPYGRGRPLDLGRAFAQQHAGASGEGRSNPTGGGAAGRSCSPRLLAHALGGRVYQINVRHLIGFRNGERKDVGICLHTGQPVTWQAWWPHLGVAADCTMPPGGEDEVDTKRAWALERFVYYVPPGVPVMEIQHELTRLVTERIAA